ncbi:MAG: response regulator, partial [Terriglobia bacterium]
MPRVLLGGFDAVLKDSLKRRLNDYPISRVSSVPEIQEELAGGSVSLLILDSDLDGAVAAASPPPNHLINKDRRPETAATTAALEALEELRANPQWAELPVIYYASTESSGEAARRLAADLRIREILLPPLDQNELARQTAQALGILLAPSAGETKMQHAVAAARSRFLETVAERLETLDGAGAALLEGNLKPGVRELARREAHKLAGLLGTIGFAAGSRFAREMEGILAGAVSSGHAQAMRYSELAVALRLDVEKPSISAAPLTERAGDESQTSILIVDSDDEFSERLEAEALGHSVRVRRARDFARAASMIAEDIPDVALASLFLSGKEEEGLEFIESLAAHAPPVPVIVLTSKDTFTDRVEVARRGGHGFLSRSSPASKILEAGLKLVDRLHSADVRIMAVDDDPHILSLLCSLLETRGALIKTLADPAQFWDSLEAFVPDLLVLDVDMPGLSGLDLCRVVRNDSRWAQTPIIFLTGHNNPGAIQRVFAAGADDFVSKPIVGPELLTRIFNRLERVRMQRRISETDLLTGAFNRRKS